MSISIQNLTFAFGRMQVFREIVAQARPGKITALIGPNAAGKSTLLRCMIGAIRPQSGEVLLDGLSITSLSAKKIASRVAYVAQRSIVSAAFSVRQVVELGRYALPPNATKVNQAIDRLQLNDIVDRPFPALSVGQQQRVTLARALAQSERDGILILDEPTSAMDLSHVSSCMGLLRERARDGATIVIAMHDLGLAASIADDMWLLDQGQLAAQGSAAQVMTIELLQRVFKVPWEWVTSADGSTLAMPRLLTDPIER